MNITDITIKSTRELGLIIILCALLCIFGVSRGGYFEAVCNLFAGAIIGAGLASWGATVNKRKRIIERNMAQFWKPFTNNAIIITSSYRWEGLERDDKHENSIFTPFHDAVTAYQIQKFIEHQFGVKIPICDSSSAKKLLSQTRNKILIGGPNLNSYTDDLMKSVATAYGTPFYNWSSSFCEESARATLTNEKDHFALVQKTGTTHFKSSEYADSPIDRRQSSLVYGMVYRSVLSELESATLVIGGAENAWGTLTAGLILSDPNSYETFDIDSHSQIIASGKVKANDLIVNSIRIKYKFCAPSLAFILDD
ncbi:hypothetical protein [Desulfobacter curvatus]|uniref:hypothetical protein n=1 Tax=Desulfobacter curvatus TaxID=2290 RepID=UPI0003825D3F|nr:hypothetical protein [Desulfobacter curvatus]